MTDHSLQATDKNTKTLDSDSNSVCKTAPTIAIIGGGLTGLLTATLLERAFAQQHLSSSLPSITIFEKSRSVGRLATRYRTDSHTNSNTSTNASIQKQWQWAFGAQFFTAKSAGFSQFIQPWLESGLLQPWCAQVVDLTPANNKGQASDIKQKEQWDTTHARYISTPKMTSWGRALADDLQHTIIKFNTRVAPISKPSASRTPDDKAAKTALFDEAGSSLGCFDWVICTAPNGQALELMANSGFTEQAKITELQMLACYTLMLGWDNSETLPNTLNSKEASTWDVAYMHDSLLDRIFIEHQKPAHHELLPSVTIHARNDWSQEHVDENIESVKAQLLTAAQQALHWNPDTAPSQIDCHRWRYASTVMAANTKDNSKDSIQDSIQDSHETLGILVDNQNQWIVSGDWCGQGNIESCYQMAKETVEAIKKVQ